MNPPSPNKLSPALAKKTAFDTIRFLQHEKLKEEFRLVGIRQTKEAILRQESQTVRRIRELRWRIRKDFENHFELFKKKSG